MLLVLQTSCELYTDSAYMPGACTLVSETANFSEVLHVQKPAKQIFYVEGNSVCYFSYLDFRNATVNRLHIHFVAGSLATETNGCDRSVFSVFSYFENSTIENMTLTGTLPAEFEFTHIFSGYAVLHIGNGTNVTLRSFSGIVVNELDFIGYPGIIDGKNTTLGVKNEQENQYLLKCKNANSLLRQGERVQDCELKVDEGCQLYYYGICIESCPVGTFELDGQCLAFVPFGYITINEQLELCDTCEYLNQCYDAQPTPQFLDGIYHCMELDNFNRELEECNPCKRGYSLVNGTCVLSTSTACKVEVENEEYCSSKCDDFYYQNGKKCVTDCNGTYQNVETKQCGSCAPGMFKNEVTKECLYLCPNYSRGGKCVDECFVGEGRSEANKSCINCLTQKMVWDNWKCLDSCGALFNDSFICKLMCDSKIYVTDGEEKVCITQCSNYLLPQSDGEQECVDFCQYFTGYSPAQICQDDSCSVFAEEIVNGENTAYRCLKTCDKYKYPLGLGFELCVDTCKAPLPYYTDDNICVDTCAPLLVNGKHCVANCSFFERQGTESVCVDKCNGYYVETTDGSNRECLVNCPSTHPYGNAGICKTSCDASIPFNDSFTCKNTCGSKFVESYDNLTCIPSCESGIYEFNEQERYCIDECDKFVNKTSDGENCVAFCPPGTNFAFNKTCYVACPPEFPFMLKEGEHYECLSLCERFAANENNLTCVDTCDEYFEELNGQVYCAESCSSVANPTTEFDQRLAECLENCPKEGNAVNDSFICKEKCEILEFEDDLTCKNTCGDRYVDNELDKICTDNCSQFISNTTIEGEQLCIDQCSKFIYTIDGKRYCVDECNDRFVASDGKNCVENCGNEFEYTDDVSGIKICESSCEAYVIVEPDRLVCINRCEAYFEPNVAITGRDEPGNKCVSSCTTDGFAFVEVVGNDKKCITSCEAPLFKFENKPETFCVERCPDTAEFVNSSFCRETCDSGLYQQITTALYCVESCPEFSLLIQEYGISKCVAECPTKSPYNYSTKCVDKCPVGLFNVNEPLIGGVLNLTCVDSCYDEELFVEGLVPDLSFLNCSIECAESIFKNYTMKAGTQETVCITAVDCNEMLYVHMDADSYLFETTECRDGCVAPYVFNDSNSCVISCPEGKTLLDNTTCLSECPLYNNGGGICVSQCDSGFYEFLSENPFIFRNCTEECEANYIEDQRRPDAGHYQCVDQCNASFPLLEGKECVAACENATYNDSFVCRGECPHYSIFSNATHALCEPHCDGYLQNTSNVYNENTTDMRCIPACATPLFNQTIVINGNNVSQEYCTEVNCSSLSEEYNAAYEQDGYCVATCASPKKYNDSYLCVSSCKERPTNAFLRDENSTECVSACDLYINTTIVEGEDTCVAACEFIGLDKYCTDECDTIFVEGANFCVNKCGPEFGYIGEALCRGDCRYDNGFSFVNYTSADNKTCVERCPLYYESNKGVDQCVYACDDYKLETEKGVQCVVSCPTDKPFYRADRFCVARCPPEAEFVSSGLCVADCQSPWRYTDTNKICVDSCERFELNATRMCVLRCPSAHAFLYENKCYPACFGPHQFNNSFTCQDSCNELYVDSEAGKTCISACPQLAFEEVSGDKYCREQCPGVFLTVNNHRKCLIRCPPERPFNDTNACLLRCTGERPYHTDSICNATCGAGYQEGPESRKCLPTCASGYFEESATAGHRICAPACELYVPAASGGLHECFASCPATFPLIYDHYCVEECRNEKPYNDSSECAETCGGRYSSGFTCVDECGAHWVERAGVRVCLDECAAYLPGLKECRDECAAGEIFNGRYCVEVSAVDGSGEGWLDAVGGCGGE